VWVVVAAHHHFVALGGSLTSAVMTAVALIERGWDARLELRRPSADDVVELRRIQGMLQHPSQQTSARAAVFRRLMLSARVVHPEVP
jgi:hypothetical protein